MSPFDYISVVLSVVIGLGLSHMLSGFVDLLQKRNEVRFYWIHTVWSALTFVGIVYLWWSIWGLHSIRTWNFASFLLLLLEPVLLFVTAAFLVPRERDGPVDLKVHYYANRSGTFGAYGAFVAALMLQNSLLSGQLWTPVDVYLLPILALSIGGAITSRPKYHATVAILFVGWLAVFIAQFGFRLKSS